MEGESQQSWLDKNKSIIIFAGIFVILVAVALMIFFGIRMISSSGGQKPVDTGSEEGNNLEEAFEDNEPGVLPTGEEREEDDGNGNGELSDWEVEKFGFGDFYIEPEIEFDPAFDDVELPLNVKVDVANYHDVNRKMDLGAGIDSLNDNGFAVLDNPFKKEADDFYTVYDYLDRKQLPIMITADFLFYYYQNTLKSVYKDIESTTFYENLWETNLKLYNKSKKRYEEDSEQAGLVNDPILEAERLELTFFATALTLLQPIENQINRQSTLEATDMFSIGEANHYSFQLPDYLKDNVNQEVEFIRKADGVHKSPILQYERDYSEFEPPNDYLDSGRLNNFYLASRWLNSVFPLYYKSTECPNCLLDEDDWRINFYAALLLSEDFSIDQELQNRWAKIYKLQSFFSGLRGDLTYLQYDQVFSDVFGDDKTVIEALSDDGQYMQDKLFDMQDRLFDYNFSELEGAINKYSTSTRPFLGMKMLAQAYWPNDYIVREFTSPKVGNYLDAKEIRRVDSDFVKTVCEKNRKLLRCNFSAYDIINLIYPIGDINGYFYANTRYEGYGGQEEKLKNQLRDFSVGTWHSNNYWSVLDISRKFMYSPDKLSINSAKSEAWTKRKLDTVIGAWTNLQVEADILTAYKETGFGSLGSMEDNNEFAEYRYIEPDYALVKELEANTEMLLQMFSIMEITEKDNQAISKLKTMKDDLRNIAALIKKELSGEDLSKDDYKFMATFPKEYSIKRLGNKRLFIPSDLSRRKLEQRVEGVKLMVLAFRKNDKNIFAVGPVFNFWEDYSK